MGAAAGKDGAKPRRDATYYAASWSKNLRDTVTTLSEIQSKLQESENVFYDRKDETSRLIQTLTTKALSTTMLVGPPHCGKTALVTHLQRVWNLAPMQVFSPFLIVDMKAQECWSADGFDRVLNQALISWSDIALTSLRNVKGDRIAGIPVGVIKGAVQDLAAMEMSMFCWSRLYEYMDRLPGVKPVLVLDNADYLKEWEKTDPKRLERFFSAVIYFTIDRGAHCVMVSSDDFFQSWLAKHMINSLYCGDLQYLGYFDESRARGYVTHCLMPQYTRFQEQLNELWGSLYELVGGCPLKLKQVVRDAEQHGSLAEALDHLRSSNTEGAEALLCIQS